MIEYLKNDSVYTVTEINQYVSDMFANDAELTSVLVRGEISNFTNHLASGHFYFSLKDAGSRINCVMFKNSNRLLKFMPQNGQSVVIKGYVGTYIQRGEYQLYASSIEKEGTGELYKKFLELKEKFEKAGYFDEARKRPIPVLPRRIGVVTAPEGSVICDILNILKRRFFNMPLVIAPAYVQGGLAAASICEAIARLNSLEDVDVIIVARGGGSIEELWPFNEESVAMAVLESKKPVISAVGHQTDFTICDFVSDMRAPTPSAAAELVVFSKDETLEDLERMLSRLDMAASSMFAAASSKLDYLGQKLASHSPEKVFENYRMHIDNIEMTMRSVMSRKMSEASARVSEVSPKAHIARLRGLTARYSERIANIKKHIDARINSKCESAANVLENTWLKFSVHDYKKVLELGYSLVMGAADGKLIRTAAQAAENEKVNIKFSDGEIAAVICR
ncbi:MAG TPA: exodeoxyribonuclease VII large subunit [Candidatus Wallbacteria bacterium]|nr:exodeoxyribonuclease VII large subunit [Candidatus Wallbacteria bacterium]